MSEINVVPYIDVMLVLLIIFMVTAPLIAPGTIDLPSVGKDLSQPKTPPIGTLAKAWTATLDGAVYAEPLVIKGTLITATN